MALNCIPIGFRSDPRTLFGIGLKPLRNQIRMIPMPRTGLCFPVLLFLHLVAGLVHVAGAGLPSTDPGSVDMSADRLALIDSVVDEAIRNEEIPGAVVLVARKGQVVYRKSFGARTLTPARTELTPSDIFDLASLTKVMATATAAMVLVEDGKLILSDRVGKYIPEFARGGKEEITVLQLLTHYSGLRPDVDLVDPWKGYKKAIDLACRERLLQPPGERFVYSDIGYFLLGEIIRRVSGLPFDEFAVQRIFQPLGMLETQFNPHPGLIDRVVPTERREGKMIRGQVHDPTAYRMGGVAGHAGLFSTVGDTLLWAQMIMSGGEVNGTRILSPLAVRKMTGAQSPSGKPDLRGFGFDIDTRFSRTRGDLFPVGSFGHTGWTGTSFWIDPATQTIVIIFSSRLHPDGKGDAVSLRSRIASVVASSILDVPPPGLPWEAGR